MVTIVRHVESLYNRTLIDSRDCGITDAGKKNAKFIKGYYDIVLLSPLRRCRETLEYSGVRYGEKMTVDSIREHRVQECDFLENEDKVTESEGDILSRVGEFKGFIKDFIARNPNKKILVITHADFVWYLTSHIVKGERFGTWLGNGEMLEYHPD